MYFIKFHFVVFLLGPRGPPGFNGTQGECVLKSQNWVRIMILPHLVYCAFEPFEVTENA